FLVRWLTPLQPLGIEAWRWAFILGSVGALVVGAALFFLPESPRWLASRGRAAEAERAFERFTRSAALAPGMPAPEPVPAAAASTPKPAEPAAPFDKAR